MRSPDSATDRQARIEAMLERGIARARSSRKKDPPAAANVDRTLVGLGLPLAHGLLRRGAGDDVIEAAGIVGEMLDMQEIHPAHPHRGNWPRFVGDTDITDLNSAPFVMMWLVPLLIEQGRRLPDALLMRCRVSVRLALEEIERLAVAPGYTNIHVMSLGALMLGGQWLDELRFTETAGTWWSDWVSRTAVAGAPQEYNSALYYGKDLTVLAWLRHLATGDSVRLQARLMYERLWVSFALRLHRPTGQLAGPHSRCYWRDMTVGREPIKEVLWRETGWDWVWQAGPDEATLSADPPSSLEQALAPHWLPRIVRSWLERQQKQLPYQVTENADPDGESRLTTWLNRSYALGTASRTYDAGTGILAIEQMANHFLLHYARPGRPGAWGMVYSRYVVNDQHWGTLRSFPHRARTNFFDQGEFAAVQHHGRAICLYSLRPQGDTYITSLKTVVVFQSGPNLERLWINDAEIRGDPVEAAIAPGDWIIVEDGAIYIAIRPLNADCLGREAPIVFERGPSSELFLSIYNYRGAQPKRFWEYASPDGPYWRGNIKAGFLAEVAERDEYDSVGDFLDQLREAELRDTVDDGHIRQVSYSRGADTIALRYDLWHSRPVGRSINGEAVSSPALVSPLAAQGSSGRNEAGAAALETDSQPVWLIADDDDPAHRTWIAVNPMERATPVRFQTHGGTVNAEKWGLGRMEWRMSETDGQLLVVDSVEKPTGLKTPPSLSVRYRKPARRQDAE